MAEAIIEEEISELKERLRYLTMRPFNNAPGYGAAARKNELSA